MKGSHIITNRLYDQNKAFTLQNEDNRIVFVIPFKENELTQENTPTKLFEMMTVGLRIVCSDLLPIRNFVDSSVHWANPGNALSLSKALINASISSGNNNMVEKNKQLINVLKIINDLLTDICKLLGSINIIDPKKNKIIPTILSRCQIFDFKRVSVKDISNYLDFVAKSENIDSETSAINVIAQKSDGSMRDALSLFDRLIDFQNKTLSFQDVIKKLNILDYEYYFKLVSEINNNDFKNVLLTFNEIVNNGFDPQDIIVGLSKHLRQLLLSKDPSTLSLIDEG